MSISGAFSVEVVRFICSVSFLLIIFCNVFNWIFLVSDYELRFEFTYIDVTMEYEFADGHEVSL